MTYNNEHNRKGYTFPVGYTDKGRTEHERIFGKKTERDAAELTYIIMMTVIVALIVIVGVVGGLMVYGALHFAR